MTSLKRINESAVDDGSTKRVKAEIDEADIAKLNGNGTNSHKKKKQILLNAFDMSTVGHLSPGQWKNPKDKSATKRGLDYLINLAKLLKNENDS